MFLSTCDAEGTYIPLICCACLGTICTYCSNIVMYLSVKTKWHVTMLIMFYMCVATADPPLSDVIIQCRWLAHIDDDEVTGLRVLEYRPTWDDDCSVSFLSDCLPISLVLWPKDPFEKKLVKGKHHDLIIFFVFNIYATYVVLIGTSHTHSHTRCGEVFYPKVQKTRPKIFICGYSSP